MRDKAFPGDAVIHYDHSYPFDPAHGYAPNPLLAIEPPDEPVDFVDFWTRTWTQFSQFRVNGTLQPSTIAHARFEVWEFTFASFDGFPIRGWLTRPKEGPVKRGMVVGHGYGGRQAPDFDLPVEHAAAIFPCARGISLSAHPEIPSDPDRHVLHGIESRETYILRSCVVDLWLAARWLTQVVPETAERLDYMGTSFAGGVGILALPWERSFTRAHVSVPTFGHHPLRIQLPSIGSGRSLAERLIAQPEIAEVLKYFDAAVAARHLQTVTHVAAALFDPTVPPAGQFAVYNAIQQEKELFILHAGHFETPERTEDQQQLHEVLQRFFSE